MKTFAVLMLIVCLFSGTTVYAELFDRGNGMIYDSILNITWVQNVALGAGSAYDDGCNSTDGRMTWANAIAFADQLVYGGYDD